MLDYMSYILLDKVQELFKVIMKIRNGLLQSQQWFTTSTEFTHNYYQSICTFQSNRASHLITTISIKVYECNIKIIQIQRRHASNTIHDQLPSSSNDYKNITKHTQKKNRQRSSLAHIQIIVSCSILQVNRLHRLNAVRTSTSTLSANYEDHKTETMKSMQRTVISTIHVIREDMLHMQTSCNLHQIVTSIMSD
jgi:hypothetical protein